ncbi:MAG: AAA family ATPase [Candidatus Edwardsbacteria bacterium]
MDYERFFRLSGDPFANVPDNRFYFDSVPHSQGVLRLSHAAERMRGLSILTGEVGTGKTMLARRMLEILREDGRFETALLVLTHSEFTPIWFVRRVATLLGLKDIPEEKTKVVSMLSQRLMEIHNEGKKAVLIIDEANMLQTKEVLEEMRGLLNLEISDARLITFLLFGLPELDEQLTKDTALRQRVAVRFKLESLDGDAVKGYIKHRLAVAGRTEDLFTDTAFDLINRHSQGRPRLINAICDNALLEACLLEKEMIDASIVQAVVTSLILSEKAAEEEKKE